MTQHDKVRSLLQGILRERHDTAPLGDAEPLFSSGRLDSLAAINVVMFLEQEFDVDFADIGIDLERIDSVDLIAELIRETTSTLT
jgi:acyl carrier protein